MSFVLGIHLPVSDLISSNSAVDMFCIGPTIVFSYLFVLIPAGNVCFYGVCDYYCDSAHAFCGNPHMIEGSVQSYLPSRNIASRTSWYQPWQRSYR